jgi:predicted nucleotidyltransferase
VADILDRDCSGESGGDGGAKEVVGMQLSHPLRAVTPSLDGDVLAFLARADAAFTGRQLAQAVGASSEGARLALARLVEQGVVQRAAAGSALMFRLNRDHLAAAPIIALASMREELLRRIRTRLTAWESAPVFAALFGPTARGEERPDSDIDLFLLRPTTAPADQTRWRDQVAQLEGDVTRWTGNDTRILELGVDDLTAHQLTGSEEETASGAVPWDDSVLDDILGEGIPLAGEASLLRQARRSLRSGR